MRTKLWVLLAVAGAWSACQCGKKAGSTCNETKECLAGLECSSGVCAPTDGGIDGGHTGHDGGDGGGSGDNDGGTDGGCVNLECQQSACADGGTTQITGKVYDPSGQIPLYNALVYVPNGPVQPFDGGLTCDRCNALTTGSPLVVALSGSDGTFHLTNVPDGTDIPLVVQIGRWRRQVTLPTVNKCVVNTINDANTFRLPRNKSEGDLPKMAIATGNADPFECLLLKMGISTSEFTLPTGNGRVHFYRTTVNDGGLDLDAGVGTVPQAPDGVQLWSNLNTLSQYDLVMLPCEGGEFNNNKTGSAKQNLVDYTIAGGRVFTTHYSYTWVAQNDAGTAPTFNQTATWAPDQFQAHNPPSPWGTVVNQGFPKGQAFAQWLYNVGASTDAGFLPVREGRHDVRAVTPPTQSWLLGNTDGGLGGPGGVAGGNPPTFDSVPHLTFNTPVDAGTLPDGGAAPQCGRVVFSDFHVTAGALVGGQRYFPAACAPGAFTPQEKALVFMLFDLSSCIQADTAPPSACQGVGQSCSASSGSSACCEGLACVNSVGQECAGGGCTCQPKIN